MTVLPWSTIDTAPTDGRAVFVWNGDYRWASYRVPVFHPDEEFEGKCWCDARLLMTPPPTHWLPLSPPDDQAAAREPAPPPKRPLTVRGNERDPLGYDTSDFTACARAMADDALYGRTADAVRADLASVRRLWPPPEAVDTLVRQALSNGSRARLLIGEATPLLLLSMLGQEELDWLFLLGEFGLAGDSGRSRIARMTRCALGFSGPRPAGRGGSLRTGRVVGGVR